MSAFGNGAATDDTDANDPRPGGASGSGSRAGGGYVGPNV